MIPFPVVNLFAPPVKAVFDPVMAGLLILIAIVLEPLMVGVNNVTVPLFIIVLLVIGMLVVEVTTPLLGIVVTV
jgi:hypothetical protein